MKSAQESQSSQFEKIKLPIFKITCCTEQTIINQHAHKILGCPVKMNQNNTSTMNLLKLAIDSNISGISTNFAENQSQRSKNNVKASKTKLKSSPIFLKRKSTTFVAKQNCGLMGSQSLELKQIDQMKMEYLKNKLTKLNKNENEEDLEKDPNSLLSQKFPHRRTGDQSSLKINQIILNNESESNELRFASSDFRDVINDHTIEICMNDCNTDSIQLKSQSLSSIIGSIKYLNSDHKSKYEEGKTKKHYTHGGSNFGSPANCKISETINEVDSESESLPSIQNRKNMNSKISVGETPLSLSTQQDFIIQKIVPKENLIVIPKESLISQELNQNIAFKSNNKTASDIKYPTTNETSVQRQIENALKMNCNLLSLIKNSIIQAHEIESESLSAYDSISPNRINDTSNGVVLIEGL